MQRSTFRTVVPFLVLGAGALVLHACSQDFGPLHGESDPLAGNAGSASGAGHGGHGGTKAAASKGGAGALSTGGTPGSAGRGPGAAGGGVGGSSSDGGDPGTAHGGTSAGTANGGSAHGGNANGGTASGAAGAPAAGTAGAGPSGGEGGAAGVPPLFFSEYVEGSGSLKALEIHAPEGGALAGCTIDLFFNGNVEATSILALEGEIAPGGVFVVCSSALAAQLPSACDDVLNLNYNGDDAIVLECAGHRLDAIGQIGVDPGSYWGADGARTADRSLRRSCAVSSGDADALDPFDPAAEWLPFPIDTFGGLGTRGCE